MAGEVPSLSALPQAMRGMLAAARVLATQEGARLYLAGGAVRDLLLRRTIRDVDLVLEGDALAFAQALASRLSAACRTHARFSTAILTLPDGRRLDVAATRRETYAHPGALPEVTPGVPIEEDLARRDFTVNAMALEIAPDRRIVDPFGGRADLDRGTLRALHALSFRDDPTRALRGVRYAQRLEFALAPETRREIARAISDGAFDGVSGPRLARELTLLFSEADRGGAVAKLRRLGLDAAIAPALAQSRSAARDVAAAESIARDGALPVSWLCYLLAWMGAAEGSSEVAERLALAGRDLQRVRAWPATRRRLAGDPALAAQDSRISVDEAVAAAACSGKRLRQALLSAAARLPIALGIGGADLLAAGIPAGPVIGAALAETLSAREAGRIGASEELGFAVAAARRRRLEARR